MNFVTYRELSRDVLALVPFCVERKVSAIYGAPRSGMLAATMLATALQLPLGMAGSLQTGRRMRARPRQATGPALLVEDSVNHGGGLREALKAFPAERPLTAAVYIRPDSSHLVDVFVKKLPGPRLFEWNFMNCDLVPRMLFDFDGVLCQEPGVFDDDGVQYQSALAEAVPKLLTTWPLGGIVTNRLNRWRDITEDWLKRHGIDLDGPLAMQPYETAQERRAKSRPAEFKAVIYKASDAVLMVESHRTLAEEIYYRSGRPVLAIETMEVFQ